MAESLPVAQEIEQLSPFSAGRTQLIQQVSAGIDQLAVLDAGRTGSLTGTATQAAVQMDRQVSAVVQLPAGQGLNQADTAPG